MITLSTGKVAIVGLGLIGGSFCKAIKAYTKCTVYGYDCKRDVVRIAQEYGAIDAELTDAFLLDCDLIISALYPADTLDFLNTHLGAFRPGCIVLDTCGVKTPICTEAHALLKTSGAVFVGGHPMAGKELSGFSVSDQDLFRGASMVLTPFADTDKLLLRSLHQFIKLLGFHQIIDTTSEFHDKMIAYTSQLPHAVASSYVKSPNCQYHLGFTGGSFEDMSRVARMNSAMWTELFLNNREHLAEEINTLCIHLEVLRNTLLANDAAGLQAILEEGNRIKEGIAGARAK